jgi:hypothetical protein
MSKSTISFRISRIGTWIHKYSPATMLRFLDLHFKWGKISNDIFIFV